MSALRLIDLGALHRAGTPCGKTSVCSAAPIVLRANFRHGRDTECTAPAEVPRHHVTHLCDHTKMTPADCAARGTLCPGPRDTIKPP